MHDDVPIPATEGKPRINEVMNFVEVCLDGRHVQVRGTANVEEAMRVIENRLQPDRKHETKGGRGNRNTDSTPPEDTTATEKGIAADDR